MEPVDWSMDEVLQWAEDSELGEHILHYIKEREVTGLELIR